jgi:hypothetical protein
MAADNLVLAELRLAGERRESGIMRPTPRIDTCMQPFGEVILMRADRGVHQTPELGSLVSASTQACVLAVWTLRTHHARD